MDIYDELGVRKIINASATLTMLGGSLMPPEVLAAMNAAAAHFVEIDELQAKVGAQLAALTRNEAAYVSCGAAAGLVLATAACIAGTDAEKRARLPDSSGMENEILVHRRGLVGYSFAIRQAGGKLVEFGGEEGATAAELEAAITPRTAGIFAFTKHLQMDGLVPLAEQAEIAHRHGIPLVVDAAAQIPPVSNLWNYTGTVGTGGAGADLAIFSGGKGLRGPQSSGLIVGRRDLIEACAFHACPRAYIGRPMKAGKEEIAGLLAAVRWTLAQDETALLQRYEAQVAFVIAEMDGLDGVRARRSFPSEAGQPMPRAEIIFDPDVLGLARDEIQRRLMSGSPGVALAAGGQNSLLFNPQTLEPGEEQIVVARLRAAIAL